MPYAHITWGELKTELLAHLGDSVFWDDTEAGLYLAEALRVWQCTANFWKDRIPFLVAAVAPGETSWKDPTIGSAYTIKDQDLLTEIEYHFLEPISASSWIGTDQFTLDDVQGHLQRRRDQFLYETGALLDVRTINGPPPGEGRIEVPLVAGQRPIIDVRRVAWRDIGNVYTHLWREDEFGATAFSPGWEPGTDTPAAYSVAVTPPLKLQLIPPSNAVGRLEIVSVRAGTALNLAAGVALGIPDNFAWVIKYGVMADLLEKLGPAHDTARAAYCEKRWQEGVELARIYSQVLFVQIGGLSIPLPALQQFDGFSPGWQNLTPGKPDTAAIAGFNLMAFSPAPDVDYIATLDVLTQAPVPTTDIQKVQLGSEELEAILDYARHIAAFKQGGQEFSETETQYENLLRLAAIHNEKLKANAKFSEIIRGRTVKEDRFRPRRSRIKANA